VVQLHELAAHRARQPLVHGEARAAPVGAHAQALQLLEDDAAVLLLPLPHALQEALAAELEAAGALLAQLALHHHLGADAGVVGAGLEQRLVPLHALEAYEGVDDGVVEGVAEVEVARDVGRRDDDGERFLAAEGVGGERLLRPAPHPLALDGERVVPPGQRGAFGRALGALVAG